MEYKFLSQINPQSDLLTSLNHLSPDNPFCTPQFVASKSHQDNEVWAFLLYKNSELEAGCIGLVYKGRLSSRLEINSIPAVNECSSFWSELIEFCKKKNIHELTLNSFASTESFIPDLEVQRWRKLRKEYVIDLSLESFRDNLSSNHKRNIKRAARAGVEVRIETDSSKCIDHVNLMSASMGRRQSRGEQVTTDVNIEPYKQLLESKAAFLHQAILNGEVLSSILILNSPESGYYHSAGTSPEGMKLGASQFLIMRTAELLHDNGATSFNLGGADEDQIGLTRFKQGFKPQIINLESAGFFLGSFSHKVIIDLIRSVRR